MDSQDLKLTLAKIEDTVTEVMNNHNQGVTSFLDPASQKTVERYLNTIKDVLYIKSGGYPSSERNLFIVYPDWLEVHDPLYPLCGISIQWDERYYKIGHRDILGSILSLGIKREKLGDIIIKENICQAIVMKDIYPFILASLEKVGRAPVILTEMDLKDIEIPKSKSKSIRATVPSMRLDCLASSGFQISRSKILPHIRGGKIYVNWELMIRPDYQIQVGDLITMRGTGRIKIEEITGTTKKDRISVIIKKYI